MSKWSKIKTLAEVISCTGTLTLLAVWGKEVMGQMVGEAVARLEELYHHEPWVECVRNK